MPHNRFSHTQSFPPSPSRLRAMNGMVSAGIFFFFAGHGLVRGAGLGAFTPLVWIGIAGIGAHVVLSVATSYTMLTDTQRPPSTKKKQHLVLKWASGIALCIAACVHALGLFPGNERVLASIVAVLIAWHSWVGTRSLLKDLSLPREWKTAIRICICITAALAIFFVMS